jgi:hypothetical protein
VHGASHEFEVVFTPAISSFRSLRILSKGLRPTR